MSWWPLILAVMAGVLACLVALGRRDEWFVRAKPEAAPAEGIAAIAEIVRFPALRRRIGYAAARRVMAVSEQRLAGVTGVAVRRVGRAELEFSWIAGDSDTTGDRLRELKTLLEQPIDVGDASIQPEIAIGAAAATGACDADELFDAAALALEDARAAPGRIGLAGFDRGPGGERSDVDLLGDLRAAIGQGGLDLHYMPKLRLEDGQVHGAEALCRWTHPRLGPVPASDFIRLAEDTGLIGDLTLLVLSRALADQERLARDSGIELQVHINISGTLLGSTDYCDRIIEIIGKRSGRIGIEITETAVIEDTASALASLQRLKAAGIHVAIDDFGVGLASFAYLRDLPADELKIDQTFVRELTTSHRDPLLVRSAIDIAHALEMEVTAEGVEDEIALTLLKVMRCDHVQGYHVSPPLAYPQLVRFLKGREPLPEAPSVKRA